MPWQSLSFEIQNNHAETLADVFLELGAISVDFADAQAGTSAERAIFAEPGEETDQIWPLTRIDVLLPQNISGEEIFATAITRIGLTSKPDMRIAEVPEQDWVNHSRSQFNPIRISNRLWIVPSWCEPVEKDAINIILDPGLAFGTGSHPTTRLCLRWLDQHIHGGESVLDYGCGSGVLAIAALKLGANYAVGVDIDEQALLASKQNAMQNRVQANFFTPGEFPMQQAQIVVANILANPLALLAPVLAKTTTEHGKIALSGILQNQADNIKSIYEEWFHMDTAWEEDGWVCLSGIKRI